MRNIRILRFFALLGMTGEYLVIMKRLIMKRFVEAMFRRRSFCLSYAEVAFIVAVSILISVFRK